MPELSDFLNKKLNFVLRWGITIMFFLFLLCISFTWFLKYPETINIKSVEYIKNPSDTFLLIKIGSPKNKHWNLKIGQILNVKLRSNHSSEGYDLKIRVDSLALCLSDETELIKASQLKKILLNNNYKSGCFTNSGFSGEIKIGEIRFLQKILDNLK